MIIKEDIIDVLNNNKDEIDNIIIRCPRKEDVLPLFEKLHSMGVIWSGGQPLLRGDVLISNWQFYKSDSYYSIRILKSKLVLLYGDIDRINEAYGGGTYHEIPIEEFMSQPVVVASDSWANILDS